MTFPCPHCGKGVGGFRFEYDPFAIICRGGCDRTTRVVPLKFFGPLIEDIKAGSKRKTFRYEDEKNIERGDVLAILETRPGDDEPPVRGYATVTDADELAICELTEYHFAWHTSARDPETLVDSMRDIYNEPIGPETPVKYIAIEYHE